MEKDAESKVADGINSIINFLFGKVSTVWLGQSRKKLKLPALSLIGNTHVHRLALFDAQK